MKAVKCDRCGYRTKVHDKANPQTHKCNPKIKKYGNLVPDE